MASVRPKALPALLALLCLTAVLFGDVARGIHLLTARHVVCPAHGELIEADSPGESGRLEVGGVSALPGKDLVDHHEHCSLAAAPTRPPATVIAHTAVAEITPRANDLVLALHYTVPAPRRLVLAYAPKQGPPVHIG